MQQSMMGLVPAVGYKRPLEPEAGELPGVVHERELQKELERKSNTEKANVRKKARYVYRAKADLERNNPSIKDGLSPDKERQWRRQYTKLIQEAGIQLRIPQWGIAVGVLLCHRFFAVKSMKRNDRFIIATACLFLAAKVEESPKPLKHVLQEVEKVRHAKDAAALRKLEDAAFMERYKEEILQAERAVLYTLGFDLNVPHPYKPLLAKLSELSLLALEGPHPHKPIAQNAWNFINDSLRTTLCLQFEPDKIAYAALFMADKMNRDNGVHHGLTLPPDPLTGKPTDFWNYFQITPGIVADIANQILSEYEHTKLSKISQATGEPLAQVAAEAFPASQAALVSPAGTPAHPGHLQGHLPGGLQGQQQHAVHAGAAPLPLPLAGQQQHPAAVVAVAGHYGGGGVKHEPGAAVAVAALGAHMAPGMCAPATMLAIKQE